MLVSGKCGPRAVLFERIKLHRDDNNQYAPQVSQCQKKDKWNTKRQGPFGSVTDKYNSFYDVDGAFQLTSLLAIHQELATLENCRQGPMKLCVIQSVEYRSE